MTFSRCAQSSTKSTLALLLHPSSLLGLTLCEFVRRPAVQNSSADLMPTGLCSGRALTRCLLGHAREEPYHWRLATVAFGLQTGCSKQFS